MKVFFLNIELYEILYASIGAFLGFFFAFLAGKSIDRHKRMQAIDNIKKELLALKQYIDHAILNDSRLTGVVAIIKARKDNGEITISGKEAEGIHEIISTIAYNIYIPIWETILFSGGILDFKDEEYFDELIEVYNSIKRLSNLVRHSVSLEMQNISMEISVVEQCIKISETLENNRSKLSVLLSK